MILEIYKKTIQELLRDMAELSLKKQAKKLLKEAEAAGLKQNFFFRTTFERYTVQMDLLKELQKAIEDDGATVTKTYVKGRENICTHPAITEYNKTATAANGTVATLIKILEAFKGEEESTSKLQSFLDSMNDE